DVRVQDGDVEPAPLASGPRLSVAPESDAQRLIIESRSADLSLFDGRNKHNNGWFVVRSLVPAGATKNAIDWTISPNSLRGWKYTPVVHVSQVGYHPAQKKVAIIEVDSSTAEVSNSEPVERRPARPEPAEGSSPVVHDVEVIRIAEDGTRHEALRGTAK